MPLVRPQPQSDLALHTLAPPLLTPALQRHPDDTRPTSALALALAELTAHGIPPSPLVAIKRDTQHPTPHTSPLLAPLTP
jgi:hypothetical protein